ncbi:MAG: zinc ribbon domain-containing protein [Clostridia bacterium]|jgi:predicted  nucleic acid-binding Zn-ribbon protein
MEQLDLLWEYQEIDLKLEQWENERKNSPIRQNLLKITNYLLEQQNALRDMETVAKEKMHAFETINKNYEEIIDQLVIAEEKVTKGEVSDLEQLKQIKKSSEETREKLQKQEADLLKLASEIDRLNRRLRDVTIKVSKGKKEYNQVKAQYDEELGKISDKLKSLREKQKGIEMKINKELLEKYRNLRINRNTAVAVVDEDKCGGCNMTLASLVVRNVRESERVVECEHCGRILYQP